MYPKIIIGDIHIYLFGIFLILAWVIFFYCLHIFSQKQGITKPIFADILSFTIGMFIFGRIFYFISSWSDTKFMFQDFFQGNIGFFDFIIGFFIMDNYNLSLAGGIIGFIIIFLWKTRHAKNTRKLYIDIIIPSFLIASVIGFLGAFLGGEIYGIQSHSFLSVNYNTKYSSISGNRLPLGLFYMIISGLILYLWYKFSKKDFPEGYKGYLALGGIGLMLFFGEFFSGAPDMFEVFIRANQLIGIIFIITAFVGIIKFFRS